MRVARRELLAALGVGTFGLGSVAGFGGQPRYTHYTYAADGDPDDRRVRVAWYERYNGVFEETQNGTSDPGLDETLDPATNPAYVTDAEFVTEAAGPVITVGDVMPGDDGTLVVGLEVADDLSVPTEPVDIWLQAAIGADSENGINEPEQAAGDTSPTDGELDDEVVVAFWRDGAPLGSCNGRRDFTERLESPIVPSTPLSVAFAATSDTGDDDGQRVLDSVAPGESRCLALEWEFPADTATNRSQGDGVVFDLRFGAVPVGASSPFDGGTGQ